VDPRSGARHDGGFEDQRFEAAFEQVGRGGQAHGAGADYGNGRFLVESILSSFLIRW
jgi:hypothetical protein